MNVGSNEVSVGVVVWWAVLSAFGIIGLVIWAFTARDFARKRDKLLPAIYEARRKHLILSAVYALGCCFRAMLPRADVQRICLYDSWLSSVLVGRSVATVAELAFAMQWALMVREASELGSGKLARFTGRVLVPTIFVAEICSWYAVVTTNFLGNAIEQSLWMISVALLTVTLLVLYPRYSGPLRMLVTVWLVFGTAFVLFIAFIDVPMYVTRYLADQAVGTKYFGLVDGFRDLATRWIVTYAWEPWKDEIAWMTLYFSAAVWLSISLVRAPWLGKPLVASATAGPTAS